MKIEFEYYGDGDTVETLSIPAKYVVCWRCKGHGIHDAWEGGMTQDEMDEQGPEFYEDYRAGNYMIRCSSCEGDRVLLEADRDSAPADLLAKYDDMEEEKAAYRAEIEAERRMGA